MNSHICQRLSIPGKWWQGVVTLYCWRPGRHWRHGVRLGFYLCGRLFVIFFNNDPGLTPEQYCVGLSDILQPFTVAIFRRQSTCSEAWTSREETEWAAGNFCALTLGICRQADRVHVLKVQNETILKILTLGPRVGVDIYMKGTQTHSTVFLCVALMLKGPTTSWELARCIS